jgi:polyphosphate kinase 2
VKKVPKDVYERELLRLQGELVELMDWVVQTGARVVVVFEGRDAAGKSGTIKRITEFLNPRMTRIAALPKPTDRERGQWYFQRFVEYLPTAGEIVLFDRSWYNRAGVEHVMGFCTEPEYERFLHQCPTFERMLVEDGIILIKYWFAVSDAEQEKRFDDRLDDPMRRWKLSPIDLEARARWIEYAKAQDAMFAATDLPDLPWHVVESDDKRRARLNCLAHLLTQVPFQPVREDVPKLKAREKGHYELRSRASYRYVPDHAASLAT